MVLKTFENFSKSFLEFPYLLIMEIILELIYDFNKVLLKYFSLEILKYFVNWYILQISAGSLDAEHFFMFAPKLTKLFNFCIQIQHF